MILRSRWLLPICGGLLLFTFGVAALQAGDRLRSATIDEQARTEARIIVSDLQSTILDISRELRQKVFAGINARAEEGFPEADVDLWWYDGDVLLTDADNLQNDRSIAQQLSAAEPPAVIAPVTTATGRDLVFITVPDGAGWTGASLPADALIRKRQSDALALDSLQLRWAGATTDSGHIFEARTSDASRAGLLDFPVPGGVLQLAFNSQAQVRSHEMRWALYVVVLLVSHLLAAILYRLSVKPRMLLLELETLRQRFLRLNRVHSELLAKREKVEDRIHQLSVTDAETGLPNRQAFAGQVEQALNGMRNAPETGPLAIAIVGLRDVEKAEQTLGHKIIASVFPNVANRLRGALDNDPFIARISNYKLALLLPGQDKIDAVRIAAEVSSGNVTGIYEHPQGRINVSPRFGIAVAKDGYGYADRLIDNATSALSDAEEGATRWSLFKSETRDDRLTMIQLESDFKSAIENNEFRLHFQPIVHTHTGKPKGFECLVRWQHPVEGLLPPGRFIGIGESTGLITDLTRWELREAVRQAAAWENLQTLGCYLSINLSTLDLLYEPLADEFAELVKDAGLSPSTFRLEITESTLINNLSKARDMLIQLRDAGFGIMLDDFGTGFSSLSYLRQLPFSAVKIDQSFTQAITWDSKDYGMVRNILSLVHFLEMETIIEGVETTEQHELLLPLDPVYCQGYLFAKPMSAIDAEEYLAAATLSHAAVATGT